MRGLSASSRLSRHVLPACALVVVAAIAIDGISRAEAHEGEARAAQGAAKVWFAPLPPMPRHAGRPYIGSPDFIRLFTPGARWSTAAKRIAVFKLYGEWVGGVATDAQLRRVVTDLRRRKIALAVETGPLDPTPECGDGIEGFSTIAAGVRQARRIKAAGGDLRYIALDEPFYYANRYRGPKACRWDAQRIATGVAAFVKAVRKVFPRVAVGDTEPITSASDAAAYLEWLDSYRAVSRERFAFLHLDMSYRLAGWEILARVVEIGARARGVPLGLIVFGEPEDRTDAEWITRAQQRIERYEVDSGGRPDHVLFQSWQDLPNRTLPDTTPPTFTGLVRTYARPRPRLTLEVADAGEGAVESRGRLVSPTGKAIPRARVALAAGLRVAGSESIVLSSASATTNARGIFSASLTGVPVSGFEVSARYGGSGRYWPARASVSEGPALANIARGRPVSAASSLPANPPSLAVDGDSETTWISRGGPPMWLEIDLGPPSRVVEVRMRVAQTPSGATSHRVLALTPSGWITIANLSGETSDGQVLVARPPAVLEAVRSVRVETTQSPSWVAWREIEVVGSR